MAITPINNVNNNLSFGQKQDNIKTDKNKTISTTTKVVTGAALVALAATGIYLATKGKTSTKQSMTLSQFKATGNKLEKGRAYTIKGEAYTGTLNNTTKGGKNIVLKYENGFLIESKGENFKKLYEYDNKGNLVKITDGKRTVFSKSIDGDTIKVETVKNGELKRSIIKNGKLKYVIDNKNFITLYNSDCSIPSGSKLYIRCAGKTKNSVAMYRLDLPDGRIINYNSKPYGEELAKEVLLRDEKNWKVIRYEKIQKRENSSKELNFEFKWKWAVGQHSGFKETSYNPKTLTLEGAPLDEDCLSAIKEVKNIHKDVHKIVDDFGGADKFGYNVY